MITLALLYYITGVYITELLVHLYWKTPRHHSLMIGLCWPITIWTAVIAAWLEEFDKRGCHDQTT